MVWFGLVRVRVRWFGLDWCGCSFFHLRTHLPFLTYTVSTTTATPGAMGFSCLHAIQQASRASVFNFSPRGANALRMATSASGGDAFYVPDLPCDYSALEPHLDTATM